MLYGPDVIHTYIINHIIYNICIECTWILFHITPIFVLQCCFFLVPDVLHVSIYIYLIVIIPAPLGLTVSSECYTIYLSGGIPDP